MRLQHKTRPAPHAQQTPATPHLVVVPPRPAIDFRDPTRLPFVAPMSQRGTVIMPAVQDADAAATQILPVVLAEVPPSAQHVNPRAWHDRTHVEDNDLEPQTRGRHVLDELKAESDTTATLVAVQRRAHVVLDDYDPMRRAEAAAQANDERMRSFAARWDAWENRFDREVQAWCTQFEKALGDTRNAWAVTTGRTNADRLAMDYEAGGTSAALYTKDQLAAEIARRDLAGSAVSQ